MIPIYALTLVPGLAAILMSQDIGSAANFGVLGASTVTNTGQTGVNGQMGVSPGTAITGYPPRIAGGLHSADLAAQQAQSDAKAAYTTAAALTTTRGLTGLDLGGMVLGAGVYEFSSSAQLSGILTLDGGGKSSSRFVFKISSTLTTAPAATDVLTAGAKPCNIFWQVGSLVTLERGTLFVGYVIALTSVNSTTGVTTNGGLNSLPLLSQRTLIQSMRKLNAMKLCHQLRVSSRRP